MSEMGSKTEELSLSKCLPGYPRKRTLLDTVGMSQRCQTPKKLASGYPARMLAFIPIPDHLGNVGQDHDGGNNVQRAILAERISADGFGCCDLPRLRSRILLPGLLEQRVRDRCRDAERRYDATIERNQSGDHALHHAPSPSHGRV